jgi:hypothetical protein
LLKAKLLWKRKKPVSNTNLKLLMSLLQKLLFLILIKKPKNYKMKKLKLERNILELMRKLEI